MALIKEKCGVNDTKRGISEKEKRWFEGWWIGVDLKCGINDTKRGISEKEKRWFEGWWIGVDLASHLLDILV